MNENDKIQINLWLSAELKERIDKENKKTGVPMSEMFRRGIEMYLNQTIAQRDSR